MISMVRGAKTLALPGFIAAAVCLLVAFAAPAASAAEGERVLDAELSLTGSCTVETLDPVADPGCPYSAFPEGPSAPFADPRAVVTDDYGNIYVSSFGKNLEGKEGRIDIFGPDGEFISELKVAGPTSLAVDSEGYLYVARFSEGGFSLLRFAPDAPYDPQAGQVEYSTAPAKLALSGLEEFSLYIGLAINRDNDHLFVNVGGIPGGVVEFASAEEGNERLRKTFTEGQPGAVGVAVDGARDRMYASSGNDGERIWVFDLTVLEGEAPGKYKKIDTIEDSDVPGNELGFHLSLAVDESTGHLFVLDGGNCHLYEFDETGTYVTEIEFKFQCTKGAPEIGVDNGPFSPNGAKSKKGRYLFVPSHEKGTGHSFAFLEKQTAPPEVKSLAARNITEDEAELQAQVNPHNLPTTYTIELEEEGTGIWTVIKEGTIPAGNGTVEVSAVATGLKPGTSYRFRVVADNLNEEAEGGSAEAEAGFTTYPRFPINTIPCANALLRTGPSALLPDCRAYELVTPGDPNAHPPVGTGNIGGTFTNRQVSPAGDKLPFQIEGGSLPGLGGVGSLLGDPYLSTRTPSGWSTTYTGPSPTEATSVVAGTNSPDQGYSFWLAEGSGSAVVGGTTSNVRYPDGHSEPLGQGSEGLDREAIGKLISEGGSHIIFESAAPTVNYTPPRLEPEAAPAPTKAVYDRTADGTLHVVSIKPDGTSFNAGEAAIYQNASLDGLGVAFKADISERQDVTLGVNTTGGTFTLSFKGNTTEPIPYNASAAEVESALEALPELGPDEIVVHGPEGGPFAVEFTGHLAEIDVPLLVADASGLTVSSGSPEVDVETTREQGSRLYLRYNNELTLEVGTGVTFAGVAEGGDRVFYLEGGDLKALDVEDGVIAFSESGDVDPVQISPDGSAAYFLSESVLTPGQANPQGEEAQAGEQNLYLSREGAISFVATVTDRDAEGVAVPGSDPFDGLGLWLDAIGPNPSGRLANISARTTPDGGALLFKSRAPLTGYDSDGFAEIYRYDSVAGELQCISCNPTGAAPSTDATLQSRYRDPELRLFLSQAWLENLRADGRRAFFETSEPLVARDADGLQDIYEWEDEGVGSCTTPGGCVYLISSPKGLRNEYLWAISKSGDDVFFLSSELLTWQDADDTPSIYDARVGGGFAEPVEKACEGEGCRPRLSPPPPLPPALTPVLGKGDTIAPKKRCGKGKHKVKRAGKVRCVKKRKHHKRRATTSQQGASR